MKLKLQNANKVISFQVLVLFFGKRESNLYFSIHPDTFFALNIKRKFLGQKCEASCIFHLKLRKEVVVKQTITNLVGQESKAKSRH